MKSRFEIVADKARIRLDLLGRLKTLKTRPDYQKQQKNLIDHLSSWLKNQKGIWTSYLPMNSELDLQELPRLVRNLEFAYPKVIDGKMHFLKVGPQGFVKGPMGFMEPIDEGSQKIEPTEVAGFLVPGLGFDVRGVRMGRGKGFYDQILEKAPGIKVGITLAELVEPELPEELREEFGRDVRMDYLATEQGVQAVL